MSRSTSTKIKERKKGYRMIMRKERSAKKEVTEDTIQDKIDILKSYIGLCESDLKNPSLKDNQNIINKINNMKNQLIELEKQNVK